MREKHTGFPKIDASGLKGSIRETFKDDGVDNNLIDLVFGPENTNEGHMSAIGFTDARILLFPVRSMKGVFAWVTCPEVLAKFKKEMQMADIKLELELPKEHSVTTDSELLIGKNAVILEEYKIEVEKDELCDRWAKWFSENVFEDSYLKEKIRKNLVILNNEDFRDFVFLSTEVNTRINIDSEKGIVKERQGPFTEEYLPMESILYTLVMTSVPFTEDKNQLETEADVMNFFLKHLPKVIQVGGNATLGKGLLRVRII